MSFTLGILLIAVTVGMVLIARPAGGEPVRFLKGWIVGQIYILGAMVSALAGVTIMINTWPF
jgi:hypothetical protein